MRLARCKAFEQHAIANACQATVTQLAEQWHSAISRAGLLEGTTPEGWAARVKRLDAITEHARARDEAQQMEDRLRGAWQSFAVPGGYDASLGEHALRSFAGHGA